MSQPLARMTALEVLNKVEINGAYANLALAEQLRRRSLSEQDRRLATELAYGTVKALGTLDWMIEHYIKMPRKKLSPVVLNILRLGFFQLFFLPRIPAPVVCNETVALAAQRGHRGIISFVNAVLRSAVRDPNRAVLPPREKQPVEHLALKYFHPVWMVRRWFERLGADECEALCQANNAVPPVTARVNTLKTDRESLLNTLAVGGAAAARPSSLVPEGIILDEHEALDRLPALQAGLMQIQDESSMLASHVLRPRPGEFIIDACGAPGGKTTHIACLMGNQGRVLSIDIHKHKLALVKHNARQLGISIVETRQFDAASLHRHFRGQADRVLVDAPCSGLGVIRRKPDSRWRKKEDAIKELPALQQAILASAADCVKPGGVLVYSTCTTEPEENEEVINIFLARRDDFMADVAGAWLPYPTQEKFVQLWPHRDGVDGFFIARLVRRRGF